MNVEYKKSATILVDAGNCFWKFSETKKTNKPGKLFVKTLRGFDKNTGLAVTSFSIGDYIEIKTGAGKKNLGLVQRIVFDKEALRRTRPTSTDLTLTIEWLYSVTEKRQLKGVEVAEFSEPTKDSYYISNHCQRHIPLSAFECKIDEEALDLSGIIRFESPEANPKRLS